MCKIIAFTNTKKLNLKKSINDVGNTLLKTETDGFGYAVQGKSGVYGEKTISKHFRSRIGAKHQVNLPVIKQLYSRFGQPSELTGPGIFHGRISTNSEGLVNTHPMQRSDDNGFWHLIHNGVVTDYGPRYTKYSNNDSEDVLHRLMLGIEHVERELSGYYAFAAIDPYGRLHIGRDSYATLYLAWSEVYETYIIATTETLLNKLNKILDAKIGPIDEIEDDVYMIFTGNELEYHQFIHPRGFTRAESQHSEASLGRNLGTVVSNGGEVTVFNGVKPDADAISESQWQSEAQWDAAIDAIADANDTREVKENDYYEYRRELDDMDASYTISDENDNIIKLYDFYKLDHISQELCTIIRPDGTMVEIGDNLRFEKRLA